MLVQLSIDNIEFGALKHAIQEALDEIATDVINRYNIGRPRCVEVSIEITPGSLHKAGAQMRMMPEIDWKVRHKVPGASGMTTKAFVDSANNTLMVNPQDPNEDPDQTTIFDVIPKQAEQRA